MRFLSKINGILKLLEAITSYTGQPNQIVATDSTGKLAKNLISLALTDIQDVFALPPSAGDTLIFQSPLWVSGKPPLSWVWTIYDNSIAAGTQQAFRFNSVPTSAVRFRSPVPARLRYAVSACQDTDDFQIEIYRNGALALTLTHPPNSSTQIHSPANFTIGQSDELYVLFRLVGSGNVDNAVVDLFFQETYNPILILD